MDLKMKSQKEDENKSRDPSDIEEASQAKELEKMEMTK